MGNGIIGKILYFWIIIIGAMFVLKFTGNADDTKTTAIVLVAAALVYIVWNVARSLGKKKRAEQAAAHRQPVRKGTPPKKKKK